jgi:hypothetical protein
MDDPVGLPGGFRVTHFSPSPPISAAARALSQVAARGLVQGDPVRAALLNGLAETSGLHPTSLERLLDLWAAAWCEEGVLACLRRGTGNAATWRPVGQAAVVAPGNLPVATWQAVAEPLIAGNRVRVRPGSGDPRAPGNLADALRIVDPTVAERIEVAAFERGDDTAWRGFLMGAQALAIYGGDDAVAGVLQRAGRAGFAGSVRAHGDLQSCAVVLADVDARTRREQALALAHDALLADGRGCMSLRTVLALGDARLAAAWHADLAQALGETAARFPAGRLDPRWQVKGAMAAEEHAFAAAGDPLRAVARGDGWWLASRWDREALAGTAHAALGPGGRGLEFEAVEGLEQLERRLSGRAGRLSTVALAVPQAQRPPTLQVLERLGVHRVCGLGRMQAPPADRAPDGHVPLALFTRLLDVEVEP